MILHLGDHGVSPLRVIRCIQFDRHLEMLDHNSDELAEADRMRLVIVDFFDKLVEHRILHCLVLAELVNELLIRDRDALIRLEEDVVDLHTRLKEHLCAFFLGKASGVDDGDQEVPVVDRVVAIDVDRLDDLSSLFLVDIELRKTIEETRLRIAVLLKPLFFLCLLELIDLVVEPVDASAQILRIGLLVSLDPIERCKQLVEDDQILLLRKHLGDKRKT